MYHMSISCRADTVVRPGEWVQNRNNLTGTIPAMADMAALTQLVLSDNQLQGPIPTDWSASPLLSTFAVPNNKMTGTIPAPLPTNLYIGGSESSHTHPSLAGSCTCSAQN